MRFSAPRAGGPGRWLPPVVWLLQGTVQRRLHPRSEGDSSRVRTRTTALHEEARNGGIPGAENAREQKGRADDTNTSTPSRTCCTVRSYPCGGGSQSVPGLCPVLFFRPQRLHAAWGGSALVRS